MVATGGEITVSVPTEHQHLTLDQLATTALNTPILPSCPQIAPDLVARWISGSQSAADGVMVLSALARDVSVVPGVQTLCAHFVSKMGFMDMLKVPQNDEDTHAILLAFYRLVSFDRETYGGLVDKEVVSGLNQDMAKQLLYKVYEMTKCDAALEYKESERILALARDVIPTTSATFPLSSLNSLNTAIGSSLIPRLGGPSPVASEYVETETSAEIMNQLGLALSTSSPILLSGSSGSGKTFYVNEIARNLSKLDNMVRIHLGDQTDSKLLIGAYTTGSKPGSFEWRDGVLTTAIKEGRWVLVEDIDRAPTDVVSVLLSLLEKRELVIPSRDEVIKAHSGFRLVGTMRKKTGTHTNEIIGLRLWQQVELPDLLPDEIVTIIKERYHVISSMAESFQDTFAAIVELYGSSKFVSLTKSAVSRVVSLNDLIKLCNRVSSMILRLGYTSPDDPLPNHVYEFIFLEALDCFAGFLSNSDARLRAAHVIGECLNMSAPKVDVLLGRVPAYQDSSDSLEVGRVVLNKQVTGTLKKKNSLFANTNHASKLMEQICVAISATEPLLLVGETGTGKTTVVQNVAQLMNKKLTVVNVSQQTEAGDLLGGFKPVDVSMIAVPLMDEFQEVFSATFSAKKNVEFMKLLTRAFNIRHWKNCIRLWKEAVKLSAGRLKESESGKRRKLTDKETTSLQAQWDTFQNHLTAFEIQYKQIQSSFVFQFIEGSIVQAVRRGEWVLLDEINLASPDTLEAISDLLSEPRTLLLSEKGDAETIVAHPDFRLFACMNPATDVGKRDLPLGLRSRFTELYVSSPDENFDDLLKIIDRYIGHLCVSDATIGIHNDVADLYLTAKKMSSENKIVDGAGQKPHFSIRTLSRTLVYVSQIAHLFGPRGLRRSLYEGFCMSFLTLLDADSEAKLHEIIKKYTIDKLKDAKSIMTQKTKAPSEKHVAFEHYWLEPGPLEPFDDEKYVMTPFVTKNLLNLVRATSGKSSVLIQGPTSAGKTSMIRYLAQKTGHEFVRINNHEHTDLQEYLGTYVADSEGKLKFKEGVLVQALRRGAWIVLDELNLAPTDVLEALNRLLDDNRELLIPETQEVVRPHPQFRLFATQNPPGLYGGRKQLSRAFRNRFLELHFGDIPESELEHILHKRALIAPSQAAKIVNVYRELSQVRQASRVFEQNAFATLRDLFRWAGRNCDNNEELAMNGFLLLGERVRNPEEREVVKKAIEKVMKVKLDERELYDHVTVPDQDSVVMTNGLRRLVYLVQEAIKHKEPILLVGETGCGKTTVCQLLAEARDKQLHIVNAHQNMETGDIIGSFRPVRNRSDLEGRFRAALLEAVGEGEGKTNAELDALYLAQLKKAPESFSDEVKQAVVTTRAAQKTLFTWSDGSLIQALKQGDFFLLDEISLADDSVLERLNSVLEPERTLLLAEKGADASEASVTALPDFQFFATMNPGGDYGKKELSLALRNRFTEIWVPSMEDFSDVETIVHSRLAEGKKQLSKVVTDFSKWFAIKYSGSTTSGIISLRNLLAWTEFINKFEGVAEVALLHGALMVFIDALGTGQTSYLTNLNAEKRECIGKLQALLPKKSKKLLTIYDQTPEIVDDDSFLKIGHFAVNKEAESSSVSTEKASFNLSAPTTRLNAMRVLRSLQVPKPILLEGSPGVGKTSLITSIAQLLGKPLTRINLSEQTDLIDLFGSDAPAEDSEAGTFVWRDAPFLRAMQAGEWVLLDEMNLASQSVLEGLNACLDHRGQTYIPELDKFFTCAPGFTVFAAQNPQHQGGGRKGLPKSFLNRFTVVYVDALDKEDLFQIAQYLYPKVDDSARMISFISQLDKAVQSGDFAARGAPWEFNMRDTMRWMSLVSRDVEDVDPGSFLNLIAGDRFRTVEDRVKLEELYYSVFDRKSLARDYCVTVQSTEVVRCGKASLARDQLIQPCYSASPLSFLHCNSSPSETLIRAINHAWPVILVGPSCSGKTSLIRLMASVAGATLDEIALNADVDSVDLVGGYEQVDNRQKKEQLDKKIGHVFEEWARRELSRDNAAGLQKALAHKADTSMDIDLQTRIGHLYSELDELSKSKTASDSVSFQWIDGILVNAVAQGHWLVLDNANLCSASVLDRLNSLLEPNGTLILNESALEDGSPRVITPHKNFRIFLTVNPKYGELSRAMRNRAVEIYVDELDVRMSEFDRVRLTEGAVVPSHVLTWRQALSHVAGDVDADHVTPIALKYLSWPLASSDFAALIGSSDAPALAKQLTAEVQALCGEVGVDQFVSLLEQTPNHDHVTPVSAFLDPSLDPDLVQLGQLSPVLALLVRYSKTSSRLQIAAVNGENNKASALTYIEKSAAAVAGRRMKDAAAPGLYTLLVGATEVVKAVLTGVLAGAVVEEHVFASLLSLLTLADQIYINTSTQSPVESQFHVYADWFEEWVRDARGIELTPLTKALALFDSQISLSRGLVMRHIWETLCPAVPSTLAGWLTFEKVAALCERFDEICAQMPVSALETVLNVKEQFAGFLEAAGGNEGGVTEEFYETLVKTVDGMDESREIKEEDDETPEKAKTRQNTYVSLFSNLATAFELSGVKHRNLSFFACAPTRDQTLLEKLTKHGNGYDFTSPDFLAGEYISAAQAFGNTKNGAVQDARSDYAYVGKLLAADNKSVLADKLPAFVKLITGTLAEFETVSGAAEVIATLNVSELLTQLNPMSVGSAYVAVFKAALDMYVPNLPYDPAIKEYVDYDMQVRVDNVHRLSHTVDQKMKQVFFGTPVEEYSSETALFKPRVFRDSSTSIDLMIREWNQFMVVLDGVVAKVSDVESQSRDTLLQELDLFQKNTQQFLVRLKHSYPRYADLCSILDRFVSGFRVGIFMLQSALDSDSVSEWTVNALTLSSRVALSGTIDNLVKYCQDKSVEDLNVEKTLAFVMDVAAQQKDSEAHQELVAYCCTTIFARWTLRRLRMEEQAAVESSGFSTNLDETAEEEFAKLFPDYEIHLDEAGNVIKPKVTKQDVDYAPWLRSYERVFGSATEQLSHVILKGAALAGHGHVTHVMPSLLQAHVTVLETDSIAVAEASPTFDFYRQHSAAETQKCVGVATKLLKFIQTLLAKWPEHDTLQQIAFQCNELLAFSVTTPVARLLAKVEQIYTFLHEWEKLASREVSVREYIDIFTTLIVSWRRLELAMWPKLFDFEEEAQKDGLGQWWFNVYEAVVVVSRDNEELSRDDVTSLVQTLNLFLSQSTIGQYEFRLELLQAVLTHVSSLPESIAVTQVTVALKAFLVYYKMFVPCIATHVAARKKTLQKDIQEVILLASWKDTNVHALKESARKSHRKLFKVVKKYRSVLCDPVKSILEGGMQDNNVTSAVVSAAAPGVADLTELMTLYKPEFVADPQKTLGILTKRISNLDQIESVSLMDIVSEILDESARLKKVTPNHVTEENKKEIGALRVEKQRFLSETLKELRAHGFKGRITAETLEAQASLSSVLGNLVVSETRDQSYFMRLIDSFSKLRSACANPAGDVPLHDVSVASAMAENILRMCIKENNVIGRVENVAQELTEVGKELEKVSTSVSLQFVDADRVVRFLNGIKSVITVIVESATNMLRLDGKLGSGVAQITTLCNDFEAKFVTLLHQFSALKHLFEWQKPTAESTKVIEEIQMTVGMFQNRLQTIGDNHQYFQYAPALVASFVALEDVSGDDLEAEDKESFESVERLCKTMLVIVQGVIKRVSEDVGADDESDDVSFARDYTLLMNLAQLLHSDRVLRDVKSTIASIAHTAPGSASLGVLKAYLEQYVYMCNLVCSKVQAQFADLSKGGFLLCKALYNLATNGFCSPEEEQDQEQDNNATATGTGLGDGSGAQDHSGDVGEDENLDDYMEQENEDQEDKEDDEDDDAVSVEGDMAGKSENAKDEEEGEDKEGEEEEEEIDDETGNLDDLDPNAMDDKMWNDDEEVQDEKEKDGDVDGDDKDDGGEEGKQDDGKQQGEEGEAETKEGEEDEGEAEEGEKEGDEKEDGEDGDEEDSDSESVDAQDDDVRNKQDGDELDPHLDESEVLELPEDMNLDGMDEDKEEGEDEFDDGLDKDMSESEGEDEEMDVDQVGEEDAEEGAEEEEVEEGAGEVNEEVPEDIEDADDKNPEAEDVKEDAMEVDQDDRDQSGEQNDEAPDMEMEGLHGQDDAGEQEENDESAVKQESGEKGSGQDADSKEEEEDVGGGGEAGAKEEKDDAEKEDKEGGDDEGEEDSRVDAMKQLGDALKEFHKKKEEIQNSSNDEVKEDVDSANIDPQEFEHVDGPDSKHDTQAMGSADRDVKQDIDDDMAMDDESEDVNPERKNEIKEETEGEKPEEGADEDESGAPEGAASKTAVEGDVEEDDEEAESKVQGEMMDVDSDEEEIEEVEDEIQDLSIDEMAMSLSESRDKWKSYQSSVADLATTLCEQLRLILEPTLATKMRGDFKTGKRLNMKRIIPYIASSFKKDKIWMRRTKPSKRQYQIMISVDDSKSMNESPQCVELAFQSIALISKALTQLESGQLAVMKFGQDAQLVHPFEKTFSDESGGELVSKFSFAQDQTNVQKLVSNSIDIFQQQKLGGAELWQLQIIISDGICENHENLRQLVRHARELKIMLVFVVIDALAAASGSSSITDIKQAKYISQDDGQMVLKMEKYLDTFPFEFYVIVRDIKELPSVLSSVLRQFYSEVAEMS